MPCHDRDLARAASNVGSRGDTLAESAQLLKMIRVGDVRTPVPLQGEGSSCWTALQDAGRRGLATRIALEDTLKGPDGSPTADNTALVDVARALLTAHR